MQDIRERERERVER